MNNFEIPAGLSDLLQEFTVSVLRKRPADLHQFAADYFKEVNDRRSTHLNKGVWGNGENTHCDQEDGLSEDGEDDHDQLAPLTTAHLNNAPHEDSDEEFIGKCTV
jgi:hypothetical protein